MSCYTLIALTAIILLGIAAFGLLIRWNVREFGKYAEALKGHDRYITNTTGVINQIQIELAVQESSMKDLKMDIAEIKADVKVLLTR
jgi:hypothetical protein